MNMNSKEVNITHYAPFIRALTFAVLKSLKTKKLVYEDKHVIDSELVPRVSQKVMEASVNGISKTPKKTIQLIEPPKPIVPLIPKAQLNPSTNQVPKKNDVWISKGHPVPKRQAPVSVFSSRPKSVPVMRTAPTQSLAPQLPPPKLTPQVSSNQTASKLPTPVAQPPQQQTMMQSPKNAYGKIQPLLLDPSVTLIDCAGPGKQMTVMRIGRREITKLVLTQEEIKQIITEIANSAHIPVLEGVFRAAVDNFSIHAVVSELIGSRFTIKKQTPYSMLSSS